MVITADHGNCEMMIDPETGQPHTAHTDQPGAVHGRRRPRCVGRTLEDGGRLCDVAPTVLALMGLPQPAEMEGHSLLV